MVPGFPGELSGKESACNAGDLGSIPGSERSPREGNGTPLQYSCLENPHGQRGLADYSPWGRKELDMTEQLSRWLSGKESTCQCRRHGFDPWFKKTPWSRKWQPRPVFLPGKSHGQRSLMAYSSWGCKVRQDCTHTCLGSDYGTLTTGPPGNS